LSSVKLARFRRLKVRYFLACVEYRQSKYNQYSEKQVMLRGSHIQEREVKRWKLRR
jgi:hypothetical protein